MELTESQTRSLLINPQLLAAGWKLSDRTQVRFEVPVVGYDPTPWNGITDWFWEVGLDHPRLVANFFSPADLERLLFIRQNRQPIASIAINTSIVDRAYQHEAIRRVCEASGAAVQGDGGALAAVRGADEVREGAAASGLGFIGRSRSRQVRLRRSQS